jgi:hypothetical protein
MRLFKQTVLEFIDSINVALLIFISILLSTEEHWPSSETVHRYGLSSALLLPDGPIGRDLEPLQDGVLHRVLTHHPSLTILSFHEKH